MSAHIDTLRRAATRLREMAEAATPGPWTAMGDLFWPNGGVAEGDPVCGTNHNPDATLIATMDPGVGLALADWLDSAVWWLEHHDRARAWSSAVIEHKLKHQLAVARRVLGEA